MLKAAAAETTLLAETTSLAGTTGVAEITGVAAVAGEVHDARGAGWGASETS